MARPKKLKPEVKSNALLDALRFCSLITKEIGAPCETHIYLNNGIATVFNGVMSAGHRIENEIYACPNAKLFVDALSKCGQNLSITQLDDSRLSIKSDKFKATVPCIDPESIQLAIPDDPIASINDQFKAAIEAVGVLVTDNAQSIVTASILMNGQSVIATDRHVLFEYWHGIDLPPGLALPKAIVKPLVSCSKKLTQFGFSNSSVTFYYEDGSWLKTQLFAESWPDLQPILNISSNPFAVPGDLFTGLSAVAPFSPDGLVSFGSGMLFVGHQDNPTASFEVSGLPSGPIHSIRQLGYLKGHAKTIDFLAPGPNGSHMLQFFGDSIRGCISGRG